MSQPPASSPAAHLGRQAGGFSLVGAVGFLIDAAVFAVLAHVVGMPALAARLLAFCPATLGTWLLNRSLVFGKTRRAGQAAWREYLAYMSVQFLGILINLLTFCVALSLLGPGRLAEIGALVAGSTAAMVLNFIGARFWVFRP